MSFTAVIFLIFDTFRQASSLLNLKCLSEKTDNFRETTTLNARDILSAGAVMPVIAIDDIRTAVDLAHALVKGGIPTLEITLRTEHGIKAIELIKKEVKGAIVGAGTVINGEQLKAVEDAGAVFAISPRLQHQLCQSR